MLHTEVVRNEEGSEPYRLFGEHCLRIERIYHLNDEPYIHYTHYLTPRMEDLERADLNDQSLYELLKERGISLEKFRDEFAVAIAPAQLEKILHVTRGTPLLKRSRYAYSEKGEIIEYSIGYYNTEMQNYVVDYDG